ncbi:hypothetical protein NHX12_001824 [Muraenolepis orangiensis]|uniref:Uncharacterized protein n=1 Tax=Muraenolepis orangiensis TaxID=630683 RepID=A0A9Q0E1M8_9TELE|nr:hypothetical protein NHX12_001824 [Muraenolepis orangiensis]
MQSLHALPRTQLSSISWAASLSLELRPASGSRTQTHWLPDPNPLAPGPRPPGSRTQIPLAPGPRSPWLPDPDPSPRDLDPLAPLAPGPRPPGSRDTDPLAPGTQTPWLPGHRPPGSRDPDPLAPGTQTPWLPGPRPPGSRDSDPLAPGTQTPWLPGLRPPGSQTSVQRMRGMGVWAEMHGWSLIHKHIETSHRQQYKNCLHETGDWRGNLTGSP